MKMNNDLINKQVAIDYSKVKCLFCGHHVAERPFEVYCNIMCKWVNERDYCTMFEPTHTMEEFMYGQDLGSPEDGSL